MQVVLCARGMCMACMIPLISAAGLCVWAPAACMCVQRSCLIRMEYTWHSHVIKNVCSEVMSHTHGVHMAFACHKTYTWNTYGKHMAHVWHTH